MASGRSAEEARHFLRAFQIPIGVDGEQPSGFVDGGLVADAGENVQRFARFGRGVANAIGGDQRQAVMPREIDERLVEGFFGAIIVALEFDEDILRAE